MKTLNDLDCLRFVDIYRRQSYSGASSQKCVSMTTKKFKLDVTKLAKVYHGRWIKLQTSLDDPNDFELGP